MLQSMELQRVGHVLATEQQQHAAQYKKINKQPNKKNSQKT